MACRISVDSTCPVGLCGLVTTTSFVPGAMALRTSSGEGSHAASARSVKPRTWAPKRSEEHTSELQSRLHLVCRLLLEKKKKERQSIATKRTTHTTRDD